MELSICGDIVNRDEVTFPTMPGVGPQQLPGDGYSYQQDAPSAPSYSNSDGTPSSHGSDSLLQPVVPIPPMTNWDFTLPPGQEMRARTISSMEATYSIPATQRGENPTLEAMDWFKKTYNQFREDRKEWTPYHWAAHYFPLVGVVRNYRVREWLLKDILAGLGVTAMLVPQGMSYAKLAGLPNVFGLYGAFVPLILYAVFGTSRQLAVGPVAVTSLMLGSGLPDIVGLPAESDPNKPAHPDVQLAYNNAAIQVAFIAGLMYTGIGIFNLGFVINLLSHSVLAGFMTGASLIIGLSQVKYLFGYSSRSVVTSTVTVVKNVTTTVNTTTSISFPRHDPIHLQLSDLFGKDWTPLFKWREFIMGIAWIAILFGFKKISQYKRPNGRTPLSLIRAFGPITIVIISTLIVGLGHLDLAPHSIKTVGTIPAGLPHGISFSIISNMPNIGARVTLAVMICLVDVIESMSIARALAMSHNYEIDPTRELRGLGVANVVGSLFGCYTTTGSFSRSAVNNECGAQTQIAGLITGFLVMLVLLWLTPLFNKMPNNAMGAIVIFAVTGLFKVEEFFFLWKVNKFDWLVFTVAALSVMFAGVEIGLATAISVSIAIVLFKTAFPRVTVLGRLPKTTVYRNVNLFPEAVPPEMGLVIRIDAPLFFGNINPIRDTVAQLERVHLEAGKELKFLVLDCSPVTDVDASSMHFLKDWVTEHRKRGVQLVFCNPSEVIVRLMDRAGVIKLLGAEWVHLRVHDGVAHCMARLRSGDNLPTIEERSSTDDQSTTTDNRLHASIGDNDATARGLDVPGIPTWDNEVAAGDKKDAWAAV